MYGYMYIYIYKYKWIYGHIPYGHIWTQTTPTTKVSPNYNGSTQLLGFHRTTWAPPNYSGCTQPLTRLAFGYAS